MVNDKERFILALAKLVQPDDAGGAYEAMQPMLRLLNFPDRVWKARSALDAVATRKRRTIVPAYADIQAALTAWVRENPDPATMITDERMRGWEDSDHAWLRYWLAREREAFRPGGKGHVLSLLRVQAPRVWEYVTGRPLERDLRAAEAVLWQR